MPYADWLDGLDYFDVCADLPGYELDLTSDTAPLDQMIGQSWGWNADQTDVDWVNAPPDFTVRLHTYHRNLYGYHDQKVSL